MRPSFVALALALALLGGLSGCGLPDEDRPRVIPGAELPYTLAGAPAQTAPTVAPGADALPVQVYLVKRVSGELLLTPQIRKIPSTPFNLDALMQNLLAGGVTEEERAAELINLVPKVDKFSITRTVIDGAGSGGCGGVGATAQIDVPEAFFEQFATQSAQRLAVGQIVLTMTSFNANAAPERRIDSVQFTVGGRSKPVPTANPDSGFVPIVRPNAFADLLEEQAQVVTGGGADRAGCPNG